MPPPGSAASPAGIIQMTIDRTHHPAQSRRLSSGIQQLLLLLLASACATSPEPVSEAEIVMRGMSHVELISQLVLSPAGTIPDPSSSLTPGSDFAPAEWLPADSSSPVGSHYPRLAWRPITGTIDTLGSTRSASGAARSVRRFPSDFGGTASSDTTAESSLDTADPLILQTALSHADFGGPDPIVMEAGNLQAISGNWDDQETLPSAALVNGFLRRDRGVQAPILFDLAAVPDSVAEAEAAIQALRAGVDLLIARESPATVVSAIQEALRDGRLSQKRVDESARRIVQARLDASASDPAAAERDTANSTTTGIPAPRLTTAGPSALGMRANLTALLRDAIAEAIEDSVMSAAAIAVGRHGQLAMLEGFGTTPDGRAVDPSRTLFDLASLTKVVSTTTAAAILVDRGELDLDATVQSYLPDFQGEDKERVTVRDLLSHMSGLPAGLWVYGSATSPHQAIEQILRVDLVREPGEQSEYSDLGLITLAHLIETSTGEPIDQFVAREIFYPLRMTRTMFLPPIAWQADIVPTAIETERPFPLQGVVHDGNSYRLGGVAGHAGLFSTAADLAQLSEMMLKGGVLGERRLIREETADLFTEPVEGADGRALGWDTPDDRSSAGRYFSADTFGHTGFTGTSIWIDPALDLYVVLLTNRTYPEGTSSEIFDLRREIHEIAARSVTDETVSRRPGSR